MYRIGFRNALLASLLWIFFSSNAHGTFSDEDVRGHSKVLDEEAYAKLHDLPEQHHYTRGSARKSDSIALDMSGSEEEITRRKYPSLAIINGLPGSFKSIFDKASVEFRNVIKKYSSSGKANDESNSKHMHHEKQSRPMTRVLMNESPPDSTAEPSMKEDLSESLEWFVLRSNDHHLLQSYIDDLTQKNLKFVLRLKDSTFCIRAVKEKAEDFERYIVDVASLRDRPTEQSYLLVVWLPPGQSEMTKKSFRVYKEQLDTNMKLRDVNRTIHLKEMASNANKKSRDAAGSATSTRPRNFLQTIRKVFTPKRATGQSIHFNRLESKDEDSHTSNDGSSRDALAEKLKKLSRSEELEWLTPDDELDKIYRKATDEFCQRPKPTEQKEVWVLRHPGEASKVIKPPRREDWM